MQKHGIIPCVTVEKVYTMPLLSLLLILCCCCWFFVIVVDWGVENMELNPASLWRRFLLHLLLISLRRHHIFSLRSRCTSFASGVWASEPCSRETPCKTSHVSLCFSPRLLPLQGAQSKVDGCVLLLLLLDCRPHDHRGPPCLWYLRFSQHRSKVWGNGSKYS